MRGRRVTGRFFVFLSLVLTVIALVIFQFVDVGVKEDVIFQSTASYEQVLDCVIIRNEPVTSSTATVHAEYLAKEASEVQQGDVIADLFTTGYSENLLAKLETTRQNIQSYHRTLLGTIVDSDLDRLETIINMTALDFKNLVNRSTRGNLQTVATQLETAMVNRQEYLRQNKRDDTKLTKLYDEENTRLNSIASWRQVSAADRAGVVSFYLDGYESDLSVEMLDALTIEDVQTVLKGDPLAHTKTIQKSGVYRIVDQDQWYVAVTADIEDWNPVVGLEYFLQIEGFDDLRFSALVTGVQKNEDGVLAVLTIDQPIGPLLYQRTGKAILNTTLSSLAVHTRTIDNQEGQAGIWLYDVPGGTFVPVEILSEEGNITLIQPVVEGSLQPGQRVLVK